MHEEGQISPMEQSDSPAHRALGIPEILREILENSSVYSKRKRPVALANTNLVARAWHESSIDLLWGCQTVLLKHLFMTLGPVVRDRTVPGDSDNNPHMRILADHTQITREQWLRFLRHAAAVTELTVGFFSLSPASLRLLKRLQTAYGKLNFPKLRSVTIHSTLSQRLDATPVAVPTLRSIAIDLTALGSHRAAIADDIALLLWNTVSHTESLTFNFPLARIPDLCIPPNLRLLDLLQPVSIVDLSILATFPMLKGLKLLKGIKARDWNDTSPVPVFPSLQSLSVGDLPHPYWSICPRFELLEAPNLLALALSSRLGNPSEFMHKVQRQFPILEKLTLDLKCVFTVQHFEITLSLPELRSLHLRTSSPELEIVDDAEFEDIALYMADLTELSYGGFPVASGVRVQLTPRSLVTLSRHAPNLVKLLIGVNVQSGVQANLGEVLGRFEHLEELTLFMGYDTLNSQPVWLHDGWSRLVGALVAACPKLKKFDLAFKSKDSVNTATYIEDFWRRHYLLWHSASGEPGWRAVDAPV